MSTRILVAVAFAATCTQLQAQPQSPEPIRILAVGGFLGQLDGFCEQPGGTYDLGVPAPPCGPDLRNPPPPATLRWPATLGGLLGAKARLDREVAAAGVNKATKPLLLITGNNQVADFSVLRKRATETLSDAEREQFAASVSRLSQVQVQSSGFWDVMRQVNADVVALGSEDFVRSLRRVESADDAPAVGEPESPAQAFVDWLGAQKLPFLATNVILQTTAAHLNTTTSGDYALSFADGTSAAWHAGFSVDYRCKPDPTFELWESGGTGGKPTEVALQREPLGDDDCKDEKDDEGTQKFAAGSLKPGKAYELRVMSGTDRLARFEFTTDHVLASYWNGLPVMMKKGPNGEPLFIVSMIDVATRVALGEHAWKWKVKEIEREIIFLPPDAVLHAIVQQIVASPELASNGPPIIVLMSSLDDDNTLKLLVEYPEIRFVLLPPDSALLGSAARATVDDARNRAATILGTRSGDVTSFSGDLGLSAVYNAPQPSATVLAARPQWIGETIAELRTAAARNPQGEWGLHDAWAQVHTIPGSPLEVSIANGLVSYFTRGPDGKPYPLGTYKSYVTCSTTPRPPECDEFGQLWVSKPTFNAVAGDALKERMRTELAVVPVDLIDDYVPRWLKIAISQSQTDWISQFVLERLVYRSHGTVRAIVPGDKLFETLTKIGADPAGYCVVGIQNGCGNVDKEHPERVRVNGRPIDSKLAYSIAIPDVLAESLSLRHSDKIEKTKDALEVLDRHFASRRWFAPAKKDKAGNDVPLPTRLADEDRGKPLSYFSMSSFEFGWSDLSLGLPHENGAALPNLDVDFSGAEENETVSLKGAADVAVLDYTRQAFRFTGVIDYKRRTDESGISYDKDEFTVGARYDFWKWHVFKEVRPYIGYFIEGPFRTHRKQYAASRPVTDGVREGFTSNETAGEKSTFVIDASRYWYYAGGLDIAEVWKIPVDDSVSITLSKVSVQLAHGHRDLPVDVLIAGEPQGLDRYIMLGAGKLLNEYFKTNFAAFDPKVDYRLDLRKRDQRRFQIEAASETVFKLGGRDYKLGFSYRHRFYAIENPTDLALENAWKGVVSLAIPVWWRLEIAPTFEYQRARVHDDENNVFQERRWEVMVKLPIVVKRAFGLFVH